MDVQQLAAEALSHFEGAERPNGEHFRRTKADAPEWVKDLAREAHGDFLPDDWRYSAIEDALEVIAERGEDDDARHEYADAQVDVYNAGRSDWLESSIYRGAYCDEAAEEFGYDKDQGVYGLIGLGQYAEAEEVYGLVLAQLVALVEDEDEVVAG